MTTILVVDDSKMDRELAGRFAGRSVDAEVVYASDGLDALQQIGQRQPDLVITDLQMPGMDGLQLTSSIKNEYPLIPVILITSAGSEEIAARALQAGAAGYVPKRRIARDLPATLQRVLWAAQVDRDHPRLMHYLTCDDAGFVLANDPNLIRELVQHLQESLRCLPLGDETERVRVGIALEEALANAYLHGNLEIGNREIGNREIGNREIGNREMGATAGQVDRAAYDQLVRQRRSEPPYCQRRIHVRSRISREEARFTIRDEGPGFDTSRLPEPSAEILDDDGGRRGIVLMRTIMDEVSFNEIGNEVTMVKRRFEPGDESEAVD